MIIPSKYIIFLKIQKQTLCSGLSFSLSIFMLTLCCNWDWQSTYVCLWCRQIGMSLIEFFDEPWDFHFRKRYLNWTLEMSTRKKGSRRMSKNNFEIRLSSFRCQREAEIIFYYGIFNKSISKMPLFRQLRNSIVNFRKEKSALVTHQP